jgi:thiamine transport system substrate-binding protein
MKTSALIIYAYSSFAASWGVGPALVKNFEAQCQCQVKLVDAGDGGALVSRLKLEGKKTKADVVVGLDETLLHKARRDLGWTDFKAFDYGPFAFVYNKKRVQNPPASFDDLLDPRWKGEIVIQDPRLSTPGLGLLLWIIKAKGEEGAWDYLKKLKGQIKVVSPNWDLAYGLFKKNQAKLVLSYWTSPAYHIQEEKTSDYAAAPFKEGHFVQTEYAAVNPSSPQGQLARKFIAFLLSDEAQSQIPLKNFMYPVSTTAPVGEAFKQLGTPKKLEPFKEEEHRKIEGWLKKWREIFS